MNSTFQIYSASAGSGKTYSLTKAYIKLLVSSKTPEPYKNILAITFTNKAVEEMKTRIITKLKLFASESPTRNEDSMFKDIRYELGISDGELQQKSNTVLQKILHNYGAFEISTIDGFTHRVIRTFAMDLKLPTNFEVELDQDYMLNKAVENLIGKAGTDPKLTKTLVDFAIEKTDEDKSWDISRDFFTIGKLLLNESDIDHISELKNKTLEDFEGLKKGLSASIRELALKTITIAKTVLTLIDEAGLEHSDFDSNYLPKYFINLTNKKFNPSFTSNWQNKLLDGDTLYPKRVSDDIGEIINTIQPQIADYFSNTKELINEIKLNKAILKNVTPLSVLSALQKELHLLKLDENKILISEFNSIISNEIKEQPTPFIYERLGEKFRHYFIDEFQDTSQMQWENLIPLIDNSLSSSNGSAMLVGDAKQSIYRWRGANVNQFIDLYQGRLYKFQIPINTRNLQENYRSAKEIVAFNNSFFSYIAGGFFSDSDYSHLYNDAKQNITNLRDGFVNISFIEYQDVSEATERYCCSTYLKILDCQKQNYRLNDICILVRKKKEGIAISDYLTSCGIPIISSETLLLENSPKIKLINTFLELLINPESAHLKLKFLSAVALLLGIENKHDFLEKHLNLTTPRILQELIEFGVELNYRSVIQLPLYEIAESIVRGFKLWEDTSDAFLQFYLDTILDFSNRHPSDITQFLEYFDTKKHTFSVSVPKDLNAVSIMTIHKSKGLEFPVIIFPFADFSIYNNRKGKLWFPVDREKYFGFDEALLNYKSEIENYGDIGEHIYTQHKSQLELDAINLLYVTLTRAEEQLYIISKANISANDRADCKSIAALIIRYLEDENIWQEDKLEYSFGQSQEKEHVFIEKIQNENFTFESVAKENHNLNIVTKNGSLWKTAQQKAILYGNLLHLVMSKIKTITDVKSASEFLRSLNAVNSEKCEELIQDAKRIIEHTELKKYFVSDNEVYNEREIITSKGEYLRPDKLVIKNNSVTIIDYKTGSSDKKHKDQINYYSNVLKEMDFQIEKKLLIYTNKDLKIVEVI